MAVFHNFIGGVLDTTSVPNAHGDSMQTVDLSGGYDIGTAMGWARNLNVSLSMQNLFNSRPPYLRNPDPYTVNYDSTNYSALGRFLGLTVSTKLY